MTYYVIQSLLILVLAYFLGAWTGCAIRSWISYRRYERVYWANPQAFAEGFSEPAVVGLKESGESGDSYISTDEQTIESEGDDFGNAAELPERTLKNSDFRLINHIGKNEIEVLRENGVSSFSDMAKWSSDDVDTINSRIGGDKRVQRENWIEQAAILASGIMTVYAVKVQNEADDEHIGEFEDNFQYEEGEAPETAELSEEDADSPEQDAPTQFASEATPPIIVKPPINEEFSEEETEASGQSDVDISEPSLPSDILSLAETDKVDESLDEEAPTSIKDIETVEVVEEPLEMELSEEIHQISGEGESFESKPADKEYTANHSDESPKFTVPQVTIQEPEENKLLNVSETAPDLVAETVKKPADNLKRISGIGVIIERRLNRLGVHHYDQIATWTPDEVDEFNKRLDFTDRIQQEMWQEQAEILAEGGETDFSMRFDRGEIGLVGDED